MKFTREYFSKKVWPVASALIIAVVVFVLLEHIGTVGHGIGVFLGFFKPVFIGLVLAYIIDPLVRLFENHVFSALRSAPARRILGIIFGIVSVGAFLTLLGFLLIPGIVTSLRSFLENINVYAAQIEKFAAYLEEKISGLNIDISGITDKITNYVTNLTGSLPQTVGGILDALTSIGRNVYNWIIGIVFMVYFLADKKNLLKGFKHFYRACVLETTYQRTAAFWGRCNSILIRYILCDLLDALIVGTANAIFMIIARMPYIALISAIVGITNLAPTFGPIVGGALGFVILVLDNPWHALWFLIFTIILQTIDGYVLKPKLYGSSFGISSLWVLVCIIVGGRMFGVPGILLAIPFAAISDYIYRQYILVKLEARKKKREEAVSASAAETVPAGGEVAEPAPESGKTGDSA